MRSLADAARPHRWDHILAAGLLSAMVLISFINVLGRYLFHYSLAFTEELTVQMFVLLSVIGAGLAFENGAQLGMSAAVRRFPRPAQRVCGRIGLILSATLFLAIDLLLARNIYFELTIFHARSAALNIPVWIYYALVVLLSLFVFRGIWRAARGKAVGEEAL